MNVHAEYHVSTGLARPDVLDWPAYLNQRAAQPRLRGRHAWPSAATTTRTCRRPTAPAWPTAPPSGRPSTPGGSPSTMDVAAQDGRTVVWLGMPAVEPRAPRGRPPHHQPHRPGAGRAAAARSPSRPRRRPLARRRLRAERARAGRRAGPGAGRRRRAHQHPRRRAAWRRRCWTPFATERRPGGAARTASPPPRHRPRPPPPRPPVASPPVSRLPDVSPDAFRRITLVALVALCFIIVTGGAVRLTGSGLGCSDWPGCEEEQFVAALELHPMVEFVNRLVTGLVSVAIIVAVLGSLRRVPRRRDLIVLSLGLVAGVVGQIVLGAVHRRLRPGAAVRDGPLPPVARARHQRRRPPPPGRRARPPHRHRRPGRAADAAPRAWRWCRRSPSPWSPARWSPAPAPTAATRTPRGSASRSTTVTRMHSLAVLVFLGLLLAVLHRLTGPRRPAPTSPSGPASCWSSPSPRPSSAGRSTSPASRRSSSASTSSAPRSCWVALWRLVLACRRQVGPRRHGRRPATLVGCMALDELRRRRPRSTSPPATPTVEPRTSRGSSSSGTTRSTS